MVGRINIAQDDCAAVQGVRSRSRKKKHTEDTGQLPEERWPDLNTIANNNSRIPQKDLTKLLALISAQSFMICAAQADVEMRRSRHIRNPFMPDTPQRIATDTSQKLCVRFGETIKAYADSADHKASDLKLIPLVLAGWLRYLIGIDDKGKPFECSPDPLLDSLRAQLADAKLGGENQTEMLRPILSDASIFAVDLYAIGLADKVAGYWQELMAGPGAVRATIHKYVMG